MNKMAISTCLAIIALNVNGLTSPIKRYRMADWIKKEKNISICMWPKRLKGHTQTAMKGWKTILCAIGEH